MSDVFDQIVKVTDDTTIIDDSSLQAMFKRLSQGSFGEFEFSIKGAPYAATDTTIRLQITDTANLLVDSNNLSQTRFTIEYVDERTLNSEFRFLWIQKQATNAGDGSLSILLDSSPDFAYRSIVIGGGAGQFSFSDDAVTTQIANAAATTLDAGFRIFRNDNVAVTSAAVLQTISLRNATYRWTLSGSGTTEYYVELAAGGDPGLNEPDSVLGNALAFTAGAIGSLVASEWVFGNNDSLGFTTVYVRLADGTDPDASAVGFVTAVTPVIVVPRWVNPLEAPHNAVGDGVTDDNVELLSADTAAGANGVIYIEAGKTYHIGAESANPTFVSGFKFDNGGLIDVASGVTVTFDGPIDANPYQKLFTGAGTVILGSKVLDISPRWFGAVAGGVIDDSPAFSAMVAALPAVGASVIIPNGKYLLKSQVVVTKDQLTIRGESWAAIITKDVDDNHSLRYTDCNDLSISNYSADLDADDGSGSGIRVIGSSGVHIFNMHCYDSNKAALDGTDRYGILVGTSTDVWITDNLLEDLQMEVDNCTRVHILDNKSYRARETFGIGLVNVIDTQVATDYQIERNIIIDAEGRGIACNIDPSTSDDVDFLRIRIKDNVIIRTTASTKTNQLILVGTGNTSNQTTGNTFVDIEVSGNLLFVDPALATTQLTLLLFNAGSQGGPVNFVFTRPKIFGNKIISNATGTAMDLRHIQSGEVKDNLIISCVNGILVSNQIEKTLVSDNWLVNPTGIGYQLSSTLGNNRFERNYYTGSPSTPYNITGTQASDFVREGNGIFEGANSSDVRDFDHTNASTWTFLNSADAEQILFQVTTAASSVVNALRMGLGTSGAVIGLINAPGTPVLDIGLHLDRGSGTKPTLAAEMLGLFSRTNNAAGNMYIGLLSGNTGRAGFFFGDDALENSGQLLFDNNDDRFKISGAGGTQLQRAIFVQQETVTGGSTTLNTGHHTLLYDASGGTKTAVLPTAVGNTGLEYIIKKIDASGNTVTVDADGAELIEGSATKVLAAQWDFIKVESDNVGWVITGGNI